MRNATGCEARYQQLPSNPHWESVGKHVDTLFSANSATVTCRQPSGLLCRCRGVQSRDLPWTRDKGLKQVQHLSTGKADCPAKPKILLLLDQFEIEGPSVPHYCLVTPVLGQNISVATRGLPVSRAKSYPCTWPNARSLM